ncbi:unnamed protein product [Calypogeia fissa]
MECWNFPSTVTPGPPRGPQGPQTIDYSNIRFLSESRSFSIQQRLGARLRGVDIILLQSNCCRKGRRDANYEAFTRRNNEIICQGAPGLDNQSTLQEWTHDFRLFYFLEPAIEPVFSTGELLGFY